MQIKVTQTIRDSIWSMLFTIVPEHLSNRDREAMLKFGEPQINVGGVFLAGTEHEFCLPNEYRYLRTQFPFKRSLDVRDPVFSENTLIKANAYRDTLIQRITSAIEDLREIEDTFTGEHLITIGGSDYIHTNRLEIWIVGEVPTGMINGVNKVFTTSKGILQNKLVVYINGLRQHPDSITMLSTDQFELEEAPVEGDTIVIDYVKLFE